MVPAAEEQEYRDKIRKDKAAVYDHYLWRKLLMAAYASHVDYMMSPEWEARFSARIKRCVLLYSLPNAALPENFVVTAASLSFFAMIRQQCSSACRTLYSHSIHIMMLCTLMLSRHNHE